MRWSGRAQQRDVRYSAANEPAELPWPLTFYFLKVLEDDGAQRWANVGFTIGAPVSRAALPTLDPARMELGMEHWTVIAENVQRYRRLAEQLLVLRMEDAAATRRAMRKRRKWAPLTDDLLVPFYEEFRAYRGARGAKQEMALRHGISTKTVSRRLKEAERRGLVDRR